MRISDVARSVAANSKSTNILADKVGRVVARPTLIKLYASSSAVGILMSILVSSQAGIETVMDDQEIPGTNRFPLPLEDFVTQFALTGPQDEIHIFLRNRNAGALTATTVLYLDPVA